MCVCGGGGGGMVDCVRVCGCGCSATISQLTGKQLGILIGYHKIQNKLSIIS